MAKRAEEDSNVPFSVLVGFSSEGERSNTGYPGDYAREVRAQSVVKKRVLCLVAMRVGVIRRRCRYGRCLLLFRSNSLVKHLASFRIDQVLAAAEAIPCRRSTSRAANHSSWRCNMPFPRPKRA
ncbi:hypothetical protein KC19_3G259000 [Ceratodon purpureus]|uniref:Uncharacterized protein n=1 Tax=Ceratodon purpureus TaxID=3225 RepID=A0A8T0IQ24_CERPU|nr:hypothetical protein KC19_3G259000 [Ceratodon purpureus]